MAQTRRGLTQPGQVRIVETTLRVVFRELQVLVGSAYKWFLKRKFSRCDESCADKSYKGIILKPLHIWYVRFLWSTDQWMISESYSGTASLSSIWLSLGKIKVSVFRTQKTNLKISNRLRKEFWCSKVICVDYVLLMFSRAKLIKLMPSGSRVIGIWMNGKY